MTLETWQETFDPNHRPLVAHPNGSRSIPFPMDLKARVELFHLDDYKVDGLSGGCYWLRPTADHINALASSLRVSI
jgi:hypothetical protein